MNPSYRGGPRPFGSISYHEFSNRTSRQLPNGNGFRVEAVKLDPQAPVPDFWSLHSFQNCMECPYRRWETNVSLTIVDGKIKVFIHTNHSLKSGYIGPAPHSPEPSVPRIVKNLMRDPGLRIKSGSTRLSSNAMEVNHKNLNEFLEALNDHERHIPIVYVSRRYLDQSSVLFVDPNRLAHELAGSALVFVEGDIGFQSSQALTDAMSHYVDRNSLAWGGAIRIYPEGSRIAKPIVTDNRFYLEPRYLSTEFESGRMRDVELDIIRGVHRSVYPNDRVRSPTDVAILRREQESLKNSAELDRLTFDYEKLRSQREDVENQIQKTGKDDKATPELMEQRLTLLENEINQLQGQRNFLIERIKSLEHQLREVTEFQELALGDNQGLIQEKTRLESQIKSLEAKIADLNRARYEKPGTGKASEGDKASIESLLRLVLSKSPRNNAEAIEIAQSVWSNRLEFTPNALKAAQDSPYQNAGKSLEILRAIGGDLYDLHFSESRGGADLISEFSNRTGFEVALAETNATMNNRNFARQRIFKYQGKDLLVESHVKWGGKPGKLLRVYYHVDRSKKKIVIFHFGDHLDTVSTN